MLCLELQQGFNMTKSTPKPPQCNARLRRAALFVLALGLLPHAQAADLWCTGSLSLHWINSNGDAFLLPSWRGDYVYICNVNQTTSSGVTPSTCLSWLTMIRSAMQRNVQTTMFYQNVAHSSCASSPTYWSAPTPAYLMLMQ